jgi:hypothetical protein
MANNNHRRQIIAFATKAHLQMVKFLVKQHCMQLFIGVSINNGTRKVEFEHPVPYASKFCERPLVTKKFCISMQLHLGLVIR